jgi:small subunit ribosomal protein S17
MTVNEMPETTETTPESTDPTTDTVTESTDTVTESTATTDTPDTTPAVRQDEVQAETDEVRARRKVREGTVVSNKMDKTAVVAVVDRVRHAKYNKFVLRTKKLYCHDETNDVNIGDKVRVMETRPLSKNKRWRVTEVLERAK